MLEGLFALIAFQLIGEVVVRLLHLPVPGPVIGMLLLFALLRARPHWGERLRAAAAALHQHLALLFVPAGVGVLMFVPQIEREWLPITMALLVSTGVGLWVTAWIAHRLAPEASGDPDAPAAADDQAGPHA